MPTMKKRNKARAQRVASTLAHYKYSQLKIDEPVEFGDLIDLLADIRHYCDLKNESFFDADHTAHQHYVAELEEG